ncbi:hypothetical protein EG835_14560, partial [bacterium]|nr:hypothetical protein [bacterium]
MRAAHAVHPCHKLCGDLICSGRIGGLQVTRHFHCSGGSFRRLGLAALTLALIGPALGAAHRLREPFAVEGLLLKRSPPHTVRKHHRRDRPNIGRSHLSPAFEQRVRRRCSAHDQVGAVAVHAHRSAHRGDHEEQFVVELYIRKLSDGLGQTSLQLSLRLLPLSSEPLGIVLERPAPLEDLDALPGVGNPLHIHTQPESVEQLRSQFAFLGIHRSHKDEPRRMLEAYTL